MKTEQTSSVEDIVAIFEAAKQKVQTLRKIRYIGCIALSIVFLHAAYSVEWVYFCIGYTQWGLILSLVLFIMLAFVHTEEFEIPQTKYSQFTEAFFEVMWCSEFVITFFFWCVLVILALIYGRPMDVSTIIYNVEVHTVPFIFLCMECKLNASTFTTSHLWFTFTPYFPYIVTAVLFSQLMNETIYPLLDWKDVVSVAICAVLALLNLLGFYIGIKATQGKKEELARLALVNVNKINTIT